MRADCPKATRHRAREHGDFDGEKRISLYDCVRLNRCHTAGIYLLSCQTMRLGPDPRAGANLLVVLAPQGAADSWPSILYRRVRMFQFPGAP